jgi:hypothetical protein
MTLIENRVDAAVADLKMIRGALMLASQQIAIEDPVDYMELAGLKDGMASIVERELTALVGVIKDLVEVIPKKEDE